MQEKIKPFLGENFLLDNRVAETLYHSFAKILPILDYHNHLSPKDISGNRRFLNITEAWLDGDHYKWRAMRANAIPERCCTGDASPEEKFKAWSETVPHTLRNPLYHWTHLELKNYFGLSLLLDEESSGPIYTRCTELLGEDDFRAQGLLKKMGVEVICTTDDPTDTLEYHEQMINHGGSIKMFPTFRPDKSYQFDDAAAYNKYVDRLALVSDTQINTLNDLISALTKRIIFFNDLGCRGADHGIEALWFDRSKLSSAEGLFGKVRIGQDLNIEEKLILRSAILFRLCQHYHAVGWVQQFHLGALRGNNSRMFREAGPDTGFDSIGDFLQAEHLSRFLDALDDSRQLTRTILYNLNPAFNEVFATMAGNFCDSSTPGKIQLGSAWWFLDQKDGIEKQINTLSNMGLLSRFVGMTTDSRSFLSFPRHEYFRRILCNLIGRDVMSGEIPDDIPWLGKMVQDICYYNTKRYFGF